jgi:hypothetical protein
MITKSSRDIIQTLRREMSPLSSLLGNNPRNQYESTWQTGQLSHWFLHSSWLKMKATCSPEMTAAFRCTTWSYIPEDRTLWVTIMIHDCNLHNDLLQVPFTSTLACHWKTWFLWRNPQFLVPLTEQNA